MPLSKDLREFLASLNSNRVEYLVVGAFAVAYYGVSRYTADLDLLVRPTKENAARILMAISQFGFSTLDLQVSDFESVGTVVQLGVQPNRIDLLTSISGVTFEECWGNRKAAQLDGISVNFIGLDQLIRNKECTGRARDLGDVEELRKRGRRR